MAAEDSKPMPLQIAANGESSKKGSRSPETGLPDFILRRNKLFDDLKRKYDTEMLQKERDESYVILDLGIYKECNRRPLMPVAAKAWESTPGSFLKHVDRDISSDVVVAKVDGKLFDLDRPLEHVSFHYLNSATRLE